MISPREPLNESERLAALDRYGILDSSPEACFDDLVRLAAMTFRVPVAFVGLVARERQWMKARVGLEPGELPRDSTFCAHAILGDVPLVVPDAERDIRFADSPMVRDAPGVRFYAGVPLLTQDRHALGTLAIMDFQPRELSREEVEVLAMLGRQVMAQLDLRRQLFEQRHLMAEVERGAQALRRSETESRRLALVAGRTHNAVVITGADGAIQWVNDGFTRLTGYTPAEARGRKPADLLERPGCNREAGAVRDRCVAEGRPYNGELVQFHKSGREIWMLVEMQPLRDVHGAVAGYLAIHGDITAARAAREALRESEARFRTLANAMPQLAWIARADGTVAWYNERWYEYTGAARSLGEDSHWEQWVAVPVRVEIQDRWQQAVSGRESLEMEVPLRAADGGFRRFLARVVPVTDPAGQVTQWLGTCTDVEALKRVEEALQRSQETLEARVTERTRELARVTESLRSEVAERTRAERSLRTTTERLVLATEAGGIGIWEWVVGEDVMVWDSGMFRLHGIQSAQLNPKLEGWLAWVHPDDRAAQRERLGQALVGDRDFAAEFRVLWPDGTSHHLRVHALVERDRPGRAVRMLGTAWDQTELKQAQQELERSRRRLEAVNTELVAFSYSVSHDLRAPLRGIDGWSQALLEDCAGMLDEQGRGYLQRVRSETQRMGQLIDDLLQLSRLNQTELRPVRVDLTALVTELAGRLKERDPVRRVEFMIQPGLAAQGDAGLLRVALENLLENAWKFTSKQDLAVIEFGSGTTPSGPAFFVRDNGAGFDPAYAGKLFAPFQRLHKASEFPGTGIGLATVHRVLQRHGGRIWADARVGQGATFHFTLG